MPNKPHIHAEVIKAWADGAEIEFLLGSEWYPYPAPGWSTSCGYRVKPEPIPDVELFAAVSRHSPYSCKIISTSTNNWNESGKPSYTNAANVKFVFDGETAQLNSVELI
jgi:hypothetical protein